METLEPGHQERVFRQAPPQREPLRGKRIWKIKAPAFELNHAQAAFLRSLKTHLSNSDESPKQVGLRRQVSTFDPCRLFIFWATWVAAGAFATHADDILGRGGSDVLLKIRNISELRFGVLILWESFFAHVGMEVLQESDSSAALTQDVFAENLQPLPASPQLRAARQQMLLIEHIKLRMCNLGEHC